MRYILPFLLFVTTTCYGQKELGWTRSRVIQTYSEDYSLTAGIDDDGEDFLYCDLANDAMYIMLFTNNLCTEVLIKYATKHDLYQKVQDYDDDFEVLSYGKWYVNFNDDYYVFIDLIPEKNCVTFILNTK